MSWVKPIIADEPQEVEFLQEWLGNPVGSHKTLWKCHADTLAQRGVVSFVSEEQSSEFKTLERPPEDKMFRRKRAITKGVGDENRMG